MNTWRTVLIGGMRFGGACKEQGSTATVDLNDSGGDPDEYDIVETPASGKGFSSYFALDVTDQDNPKLLWEFTDPALGYASSNVSVVRVEALDSAGDQDEYRNGHWFVVIGSGPTGPILNEFEEYQFLANSDQPLNIFVLDLKSGDLLAQTARSGDSNYVAALTPVDTTGAVIENAFSGTLLDTTYDPEIDYSDNVMYMGYTQKSSGINRWHDGGLGRILFFEDPDPANWQWWPLIDHIGPVVSAPEAAGHQKTGAQEEVWVFFATGRYFYERDLTPDDRDSRRHLFGIKDPCTYDIPDQGVRFNCVEKAGEGKPTSVEGDWTTTLTLSTATTASEPALGWYIPLYEGGTETFTDENGNETYIDYGAERVITDPLFSPSIGTVFFTSFVPYTQPCLMGGDSFIWSVVANTGGENEALKVSALLQSSTGAIEKVELKAGAGGGLGDVRRSRRVQGVPPMSQGFAVFSNPPPAKRILHIQER